MKRDSDLRIFMIVLSLAVVCSVVVSVTAVVLKPIQQKNASLNRRKNVLIAAGEYSPGININMVFDRIRSGYVKMGEGKFIPDDDVSGFYDNLQQLSSAEETSMAIEGKKYNIGFSKVPDRMPAYIFTKNGKVEKIVVMVYGKGLWSTMYGFLSISGDGNTVKGITFYEHGETPGLGGKIDNDAWQNQWKGKKIYDENGNLKITVIKGEVASNDPEKKYRVDGLSGASMTTNGVNNLVRFWMSEKAFGPFLKRISGIASIEELINE